MHATVYKTGITASLITAICQVFFFTHCIQQGNFKETAVLALYSLHSFLFHYDRMMDWYSEREPSSPNNSQSQNTTDPSTSYRQQCNDPLEKTVENLEESKTLERYHCPILQGLTKNPFLDPTDLRTVFDHESILRALEVYPRSPVSKKPLSADDLIPLPAAKKFITDRLNSPDDPLNEMLQYKAKREYKQWKKLSTSIIAANQQYKKLMGKCILPPKTLKRIISSLSELPGPHEAEPRQESTTNRNGTESMPSMIPPEEARLFLEAMDIIRNG